MPVALIRFLDLSIAVFSTGHGSKQRHSVTATYEEEVSLRLPGISTETT